MSSEEKQKDTKDTDSTDSLAFQAPESLPETDVHVSTHSTNPSSSPDPDKRPISGDDSDGDESLASASSSSEPSSSPELMLHCDDIEQKGYINAKTNEMAKVIAEEIKKADEKAAQDQKSGKARESSGETLANSTPEIGDPFDDKE